MAKDNIKKSAISYRLAGGYGMIFAICFLLYGGVKIVLGILDRNLTDIANPIFFLIVGLVLISFSIAYYENKKWGWYGSIGINSLVIIFGLWGIFMNSQYLDIILLILSATMLFFLFMPTTKQYFLKNR
ncbi:MAG: hypothetical protein DRP35_02530 [Candidatus Zixiibacteriota bacterium]|nr:MAG: hypothetical protein DRP35_02530 [candidate division Zixibacteria bacterium]